MSTTRDLVETWAQRWLADRGVWLPDATHAHNMQRCAEARQRWQTMGAAPGKDWARRIVADYREGVVIPAYAVNLAHAALELEVEPQALRRPRRPVARPDIRDRQAGDIDVEF